MHCTDVEFCAALSLAASYLYAKVLRSSGSTPVEESSKPKGFAIRCSKGSSGNGSFGNICLASAATADVPAIAVRFSFLRKFIVSHVNLEIERDFEAFFKRLLSEANHEAQ